MIGRAYSWKRREKKEVPPVVEMEYNKKGSGILPSEVLSADLSEVLFSGKIEKIDRWLEKNPSTEKRWVKLGRSGRIMTVAEYLKEG